MLRKLIMILLMCSAASARTLYMFPSNSVYFNLADDTSWMTNKLGLADLPVTNVLDLAVKHNDRPAVMSLVTTIVVTAYAGTTNANMAGVYTFVPGAWPQITNAPFYGSYDGTTLHLYSSNSPPTHYSAAAAALPGAVIAEDDGDRLQAELVMVTNYTEVALASELPVLGTYPVFELALGGAWTDFELKASTNNFVTLCYYVISSTNNALADDPDVWTYYTDDYAVDTRQWFKATVATPITSQLTDALSSCSIVVVQPSHACAVPWQQWMSSTNNALIWSYIRYDAGAFEMNAGGTKQRWNAVVPTEWRTNRITR